MNKKYFISIVGLPVISVTPIFMIACSSTLDLDENTTKKLAFEQVANNAENGNNFVDVAFNELTKIGNSIIHDDEGKKYRSAFFQYISELEKVKKEIDSNSELASKMKNLNFSQDNQKTQEEINVLIKQLKLIKPKLEQLFKEFLNNFENDKNNIPAIVKEFKNYKLNDKFYFFKDYDYLVGKNNKWNILEKLKFSEYNTKKYIEKSINTNRFKQEWKKPTEYSSPYIVNYDSILIYRDYAMAAGKALQATINRKIQVLAIAKASLLQFDSDAFLYAIKKTQSYQYNIKNTDLLIELKNYFNILENEKINQIINSMLSKIDYQPTDDNQFFIDDTVTFKKALETFRIALLEFYAIFKGQKNQNNEWVDKGVFSITKEIKKQINSIPQDPIDSLKKFNQYNFSLSEISKNYSNSMPHFMNVIEKQKEVWETVMQFLTEARQTFSIVDNDEKKSIITDSRSELQKIWQSEIEKDINKLKENLSIGTKIILNNSLITDYILIEIALENFENVNWDDLNFEFW